ncbi:hypothetical protein [Pseudanabaena yagii]|uniref:Uncharacterized protein n=1 Tax=Pseudanabaena yagii GIHE-NHR1 TaxID=2722753 RepID=A0ABX1LK10_9CYAN|nr:hypothetical protein [Pseudanabaena yagii]NMF56453.1 hypothetical protein [Pseudanabaena yagii GIHE-NHR1]
MTDQPKNSENQQSQVEQTQKKNSQLSDSNTSQGTRKSKFPKIGLPKFKIPKLGLPKFKINLTVLSDKKRNFLWLWLLTILASYACMGYFLSILMTIPSRKNLAIAGFTIVALLPTITGLADYELMKWGYFLSGLLIVGGLIFVVKIKFYFMVLAIMSWLGITAIAFVGESLIKNKHKFIIAIMILTIPCLLGLGIGWQIWKLATQWS